MMKVILTNQKLAFSGSIPLVKLFDKRTSYYVDGYYFSKAYKDRHWDGKTHLMEKIRGEPGWYTTPPGLIDELLKCARYLGEEYEVDDKRRLPSPNSIEVDWNPDFELRDYQREAIEAVLSDRGLSTGKCLLDLAPRAGKSVISGGFIARVKAPTIFIANTERIFTQTKRLFEKLFDCPIGLVGGGVWDPKDITVAGIQALVAAAKSPVRQGMLNSLLGRFDVVFGDECFAPGTLVQTVDGAVPIEEIRAGDCVLSWNESMDAPSTGRVSRVYKKFSRDLVRVHVGGDFVVCTSDHLWLTEDRGWVKAASLRYGGSGDFADSVKVLRSDEVQRCSRVERVEALRIGTYVYDLEVDADHTYVVGKGFVVHNCHHFGPGQKWRNVLQGFDAYYKIGLSGTIFLSSKKAPPTENMWFRAVTGPVVFERSINVLIRQGWLVQPTLDLVQIEGPEVSGNLPWREIEKAGIEEHPIRNRAIVSKALQYSIEQGMPTIVVVKTIAHVHLIKDMMRRAGIRAEIVIGSTKVGQRDEIVDRFNAGEVDVMIGTVFGEGVDIPAIQCVIVAAGGKSRVAAFQRFRNLTPHEGKDRAIFVDFMDLHNRKLAEHSMERLSIYRENEMFIITTSAYE